MAQGMFVCIVEIEQSAGFTASQERPVIALCDFESSSCWISSRFAEELETAGSTKLTHTNRSSGRKGRKPSHVHIRWSCAILGQNYEEGIFVIEPGAQFKISFGCAYNIHHISSKRYQSSYDTRRKGKRTEQELPISYRAVEAFCRGIEEGVLLPLEKMPQLSDGPTPMMAISDLEDELAHTYESYSFTNRALNIASNSQADCSYPQSSYGDAFNEIELTSLKIDNEISYIAASTTASFSEKSRRAQTVLDKLQRGRVSTSLAYSLEGWATQSLSEEPQPWLPRTYRSEKDIPSFKRCRELTMEQQAKLAISRESIEKEAFDYWQWDEEAQNYKHYDEGCSEPVWYNPLGECSSSSQ